MSDQSITAHVTSKPLISMIDAATVTWKANLVEAEAAKETQREADIARVIATKKAWFGTRTRTRDQAIAYLRNSWVWLLEERRAIGRAEYSLTRLAEIRDIAAEENFKNITLPESDLRLVGGHSE